jgi:signal transduction histidine kinase
MRDRAPNEEPRARLRDRLADAELLVPGLVHEARHPLTGIRAGLELLAEAMGHALTGRDEWQLVATQVARLEELFRSYQEFIAPEEVQAVPFEVAPIVLRATALARFRARPLGSRFAVTLAAGPPVGLGTPSALLHAVTNLVLNALDAVEGEAERARVEVRLLPAPGAPARPQVRVADNGCGVPTALRERIFEPLFTTKGPRRGSGLGLHTARRMIEAFGGTVRLLDEADPARPPWARTEFAVELAAAEVAP